MWVKIVRIVRLNVFTLILIHEQKGFVRLNNLQSWYLIYVCRIINKVWILQDQHVYTHIIVWYIFYINYCHNLLFHSHSQTRHYTKGGNTHELSVIIEINNNNRKVIFIAGIIWYYIDMINSYRRYNYFLIVFLLFFYCRILYIKFLRNNDRKSKKLITCKSSKKKKNKQKRCVYIEGNDRLLCWAFNSWSL